MRLLPFLGATTVLVACQFAFAGTTSNLPVENPLIEEWTGPYGGVPPFDRMQLADIESAFEAGMTAHLAEIDAIANNQERATFENTIVALERAGSMLDRTSSFWGLWSSNLSSPEFREIQGRMVPKISEYESKITQNAALFARVKSVYEADNSGRPADEQRLIWLVYSGFAKDGAELSGEKKERYAAIDKRLAELYTKFGNNVLNDEENYVTYLREDQLGGLSDSFIAAAAAAAKARGHEGEFAITNTVSISINSRENTFQIKIIGISNSHNTHDNN